MNMILDIAIGLGAILAAAYCLLLSRRLRGLTRLDGEVGKAIAMLSQQVDELTKALKAAEQSTDLADTRLRDQISKAETAARKLELLMAAGHPQATTPPPEPHVSAVAPRAVTGTETPDGNFAPFGRATATRLATRARSPRSRDYSEVST